MKTLSGHCESSKEIALSKATKILFKFVSADNGASQVINAYLFRASAAFNELNQFHRELKPSQSRRKNRESHTTDDSGRVVESYAKSVDVKPENEFVRERVHDENARKKKKNKKKDKNLEGENAKEKEQHREMEKNASNNKKVENGKGQEQKEVEKKLCNSARSENGGLVGFWDIEIRSKMEHEAKLHVEEVKTEQTKKKRKNENVEDGYGKSLRRK
ncbi:uncharacterized protein LOC131620902 [Vicia villosa]|uniref:uncharacterized protein LOC131620902 n=1 Tax=Vicia villosa TaxID=3911 RepID=UPI00273C41D9|nr:uncharacterized protein LOC131620902 [Vicia villosa]